VLRGHVQVRRRCSDLRSGSEDSHPATAVRSTNMGRLRSRVTCAGRDNKGKGAQGRGGAGRKGMGGAGEAGGEGGAEGEGGARGAAGVGAAAGVGGSRGASA
jgi:hypothetical protein